LDTYKTQTTASVLTCEEKDPIENILRARKEKTPFQQQVNEITYVVMKTGNIFLFDKNGEQQQEIRVGESEDDVRRKLEKPECTINVVVEASYESKCSVRKRTIRDLLDEDTFEY
jgi:hypothetical protein